MPNPQAQNYKGPPFFPNLNDSPISSSVPKSSVAGSNRKITVASSVAASAQQHTITSASSTTAGPSSLAGTNANLQEWTSLCNHSSDPVTELYFAEPTWASSLAHPDVDLHA